MPCMEVHVGACVRARTRTARNGTTNGGADAFLLLLVERIMSGDAAVRDTACCCIDWVCRIVSCAELRLDVGHLDDPES
jgi:hypothetical protein